MTNLHMSKKEEGELEPVWCIAANILHERKYGPNGVETRRGTKHFAPGAKVYIIDFFWGMGGEKVTVVGHHRKSHRYITIVVFSKWLANWRAELVYSPYVVHEVIAHAAYKPDAKLLEAWPLVENENWASGDAAKAKVERIIENMKSWHETANVIQPPITRDPKPNTDNK